MKWLQKSDFRWARECGRYSVHRELSFAGPKDYDGRWVYLAWFKPSPDAMAECISAEKRSSLEAAIADATHHLITQQRQTAA